MPSGVYKRTKDMNTGKKIGTKIKISKMIKLCECDCGGFAKPGKRFINGHQRRGKYHSKKSIEKMRHFGKENSMFGKHHSEDTKKKISISELGKIVLEKTKIKISKSCMGRKLSEKTKIKIRKTKLGKNLGNKHWNWQGGITKFPYPSGWIETLREAIRQRDSYICQLCGKTHKENGQRLSIHHIDYDKNNLEPKNLIALCRRCNAKVNYNREYWMKFFQEKLRDLKL